MEEKQFLGRLNGQGIISSGLIDYLLSIMQRQDLKKGTILLSEEQSSSDYWLIFKGSARSFITHHESREQSTVWFWYEGGAIFSFSEHHEGAFHEAIQVLEDSILYVMPFKELPELIRLFPEYYLIEKRLFSQHYHQMVKHMQDFKELKAEARFSKLMAEHPKLFNTTLIKHIASFLATHPDTISHLRSNR